MSASDVVSALRSPPDLQLLCQVSVLKQVHLIASRMESEYFDTWLQCQLEADNRAAEQRLDIRGPECDTRDVVKRYQDRAKDDLK